METTVEQGLGSVVLECRNRRRSSVWLDLGGSFLIWFVAVTAAFYCYFFSTPDSISLAVHERGFRYKKRLVPFSNLLSVETGRTLSGLEAGLAAINQAVGCVSRRARMAANVLELSASLSITVRLRDGSSFTMKNALAQYEPSDLEMFFELVNTECGEGSDDSVGEAKDTLSGVEPGPVEAHSLC